MELIELEKKLFDVNHIMFVKLSEQQKLIEASGEAEYNYDVELAKKMLALELEGKKPTILLRLAKGDVVIAKLRKKKVIAKAIADACKEAIKCHRASMSSIQSLISTRKEEMKLK